MKPPAQEAAKEEKIDPRTRLPGKIQGMGWHIPWYARDPKNPKGPTIPVLIADAVSGEITNQNDNPTIAMHQMRAKLFRDGQYIADVEADQVTADQRNR